MDNLKLVFKRKIAKESREIIQKHFDKNKPEFERLYRKAVTDIFIYGYIIDPELKEILKDE